MACWSWADWVLGTHTVGRAAAASAHYRSVHNEVEPLFAPVVELVDPRIVRVAGTPTRTRTLPMPTTGASRWWPPRTGEFSAEPVIVGSRSTLIPCGDPQVCSTPRRRRRGHRTRSGPLHRLGRTGGRSPRYLLAGPDRASNLLELVVLVLGGDELVIHAMGLRRSTAQELFGDE